MIIQLSSPLPCQTMRDRAHLCERPTTIALLKTLETFDASNYSLHPICPACIAQLAAAAGQASAQTEQISTATIKQVLAARLGLEGADEALGEMRAAGVDEGDEHAED